MIITKRDFKTLLSPTMTNYIETVGSESKNQQIEWFDDFISQISATIKSHKLMIETDIASKEIKSFYNAIFNNNTIELAAISIKTGTVQLVQFLVIQYLEKIGDNINQALNISLYFSNEGILVWVVLPDDREDIEDIFWSAQLKVNGEYGDKGIFISSTIVEESDNISIPSHYNMLIDKKITDI